LGKLFGLVGTVGVHFDQDVVTGLQPPLEAGNVSRAQAFLALAVQDMDLGIVGGKAVGKLPGAVRAVVINHQHVRRRNSLPKALERLGQRFQFVVGGNDRKDAHKGPFLVEVVGAPDTGLAGAGRNSPL